MAFGQAVLKDKNQYGSGLQYKIGGNSLNFNTGDFVKLSGANIIMADATTAIEGVCVTDITTAVNNTTVAMKLIGYVGGKDHTSATWKVAITGGTITAADEGKYFNLVLATQKVDGATKSTSTGQLRLERFLSATTCLFSISNKGL